MILYNYNKEWVGVLLDLLLFGENGTSDAIRCDVWKGKETLHLLSLKCNVSTSAIRTYFRKMFGRPALNPFICVCQPQAHVLPTPNH